MTGRAELFLLSSSLLLASSSASAGDLYSDLPRNIRAACLMRGDILLVAMVGLSRQISLSHPGFLQSKKPSCAAANTEASILGNVRVWAMWMPKEHKLSFQYGLMPRKKPKGPG